MLKEYLGSLGADLTHKPIGHLFGKLLGWATGKAAETVEKVIAFNKRAEFVRALMAKMDPTTGTILFPNLLHWLEKADLEHRENRFITLVCEIIFEEKHNHSLEGLEKSAKELKEALEHVRHKGDLPKKLKALEEKIEAMKAHGKELTMRENAIELLEDLNRMPEVQFNQMLNAVHHNPIEQWFERVNQKFAGPLQAFADELGKIPGAER